LQEEQQKKRGLIMEAIIETITVDDEQPLVRVTLTVRRNTYRAPKPKEDDYIMPWMRGAGYERELADSVIKFNFAMESWKTSETMRRYQNNSIDALRLGDCSLLQDPFHPEEAPQ
jgi:hypothetical protein